jgi:hypothetical protein
MSDKGKRLDRLEGTEAAKVAHLGPNGPVVIYYVSPETMEASSALLGGQKMLRDEGKTVDAFMARVVAVAQTGPDGVRRSDKVILLPSNDRE